MCTVHRGTTRFGGAGARSKFDAPKLRTLSKYAALKKVLVTLLGFFGVSHSDLAPHGDSAPGKLCALLVTPLTVQYLVAILLSNLHRG